MGICGRYLIFHYLLTSAPLKIFASAHPARTGCSRGFSGGGRTLLSNVIRTFYAKKGGCYVLTAYRNINFDP